MFGSCNNLIENSVQPGQPLHQQSTVLLTRARSPCGKLGSSSHHNGGNGNGFNDGGVTVQLQPQTHWSHQHATAAAAAAAAVTTSPKSPPKDMDDLIHLPGPLTEDAVMRTLQARFADGKHFVRIRPCDHAHLRVPGVFFCCCVAQCDLRACVCV